MVNTQTAQESPRNWKKTTCSCDSVSFMILLDKIHLSHPSICLSIHPVLLSIHASVHSSIDKCCISEVNRIYVLTPSVREKGDECSFSIDPGSID